MPDLAKQRIYIVGGGSVGLTLARLFSEARAEKDRPILISRTNLPDLSVQLIEEFELKSLKIESVSLGSIGTLESPAILFITVKSYDLLITLKALKPHLKSGHSLVLIQNGLGIFNDACELFMDRKVSERPTFVRLLLDMGMEMEERISSNSLANFVRVSIRGKFNASIAVPKGKEIHQWLELLNLIIPADILGLVTPKNSILEAEWNKLALNLVVNPLSTLKDSPNRIVYEDPSVFEQAECLLKEACAVALKEGIILPSMQELLPRIKNSANNICSMLKDKRQGRRLELDYLLVKLVSLGNSYGLTMNETKLILDKLIS